MWYGIAGILTILLAWQQGLLQTSELVAFGFIGGIPALLILGLCWVCEDSHRRTMSVGNSRKFK